MPQSAFGKALQGFDQFKSVSRDLTRGTAFGGLFTAIAYALLVLLLVAEIGSFLRTSYSTNVQLDEKIDESIEIQFDVTLFDLPCKYLQVGVWDKFGKERMLGKETLVYSSLGRDGMATGMSYTKEEIAILERTDTVTDVTKDEAAEFDADWAASSDHFKHNDFNSAVTFHDFTLVNFYAEWCSHCRKFHPSWKAAAGRMSEKTQFTDAEGKQTTVKFLKMNCVDFKDKCMEIKIQAFPTLRLYKRDGSFELFSGKRNEDSIESFLRQSIQNSHFIIAKHHLMFNEGCQVKGTMQVPRVQGHLYLQAKPFSNDIALNPALTNVSHMVNHLSFGAQDSDLTVKQRARELKGLSVPVDIIDNLSPLDGRSYIVQQFHQAPEHFLKVIGTRVMGKNVLYQITHTDRVRRLAGEEKNNVPQARFVYDFSPLSVIVKTSSKRWYEFLTSLCAILGGTFTVIELTSGAVDTVHHTVKSAMGKDL